MAKSTARPDGRSVESSQSIKQRRFYVLLSILSMLLVAYLFWSTCTSVFRLVDQTILKYILAVSLMLAVLLVALVRAARPRAFALSAVTILSVLIVSAFGRQLRPIAGGVVALNAMLFGVNTAFRRNPRQFSLRSVLVVGGLGVGLALGELAAQIISRAPRGSVINTRAAFEKGLVSKTRFIRIGTKTTHTGHNANSIIWVEAEEFRHEVAFNSHGFRGKDLEFAKPADTVRVMLLGDSFIEALQVRDGETIQARLAELIKRQGVFAGRKAEVFGVGHSGDGTLHEYLYFRKEGYKYRPDIVVLAFAHNDPVNNLPLGSFERSDERSGGRFVLGEDDIALVEDETIGDKASLAIQRVLDRFPRFVIKHSALWQAIYAMATKPVTVEAVRGVGEVNMERALMTEAWENTEAAIRLLKRRVEEAGGRLVLMSIPTVPSLTRRDDAQEAISEHLGEISSSYRIPWLDLLPYYKAFVEAGHRVQPDIYGRKDTHWTASGHRETAGILLRWLVENRIVE